MTDILWVDDPQILSPLPDQNILDWLTKPYVLSKALKRFCQHLEMKVLLQERSAATNDENRLLPAEKELPLVREVVLLGDGVPFTMGRVIIPFMTLQAHPPLNELGDQLLGETLLYNNSSVTRSPFSFALISSGEYARRSLFWINARPLLVTDIFLSSLPEYVA